MGVLDIDIGGIFDSVGEIADDLYTSKEELKQLELEEVKVFAALDKGQMAVNAQEAQHISIFVAGWRPAIGWFGAFALGYAGLLHPFLLWIWYTLVAFGWIPKEAEPPPYVDTGILGTIVTGMLGIGTMRTYDKLKNTDTRKVGKKK